jgi:hypothetical protein
VVAPPPAGGQRLRRSIDVLHTSSPPADVTSGAIHINLPMVTLEFIRDILRSFCLTYVTKKMFLGIGWGTGTREVQDAKPNCGN